MKGLRSGAGIILSYTPLGMSLRKKEQNLGVSDMKSAMTGKLNSSKSQGHWVEGQCLCPQFALTAVHLERMLLLD